MHSKGEVTGDVPRVHADEKQSGGKRLVDAASDAGDDYKDLAKGFPWHVQSSGRVVDSFSRFVFETRPGARDERDLQSNEDILRSLTVARLGATVPDMLSVIDHLVRTNKALMQAVFEDRGTTDSVADAEDAVSRAGRLLHHLFPPPRHAVPFLSDVRAYGTPVSPPMPRHDDPVIAAWIRDVGDGNIPSPDCAAAFCAMHDSDRFRVMQDVRRVAYYAGRDLHPSKIDRLNRLAQTPGVATVITPDSGDLLYGKCPQRDGEEQKWFAVLYDETGVPEFKETGIDLDCIAEVFGDDVRNLVEDDLGRPDPGDLENYRRIRINLEGYRSFERAQADERPRG